MNVLKENDFETAPDMFFVSRPDYFKVVYKINDHMDRGMKEWERNPSLLLSGIRSLWRQGIAEITRRKGQLIYIRPDRRCPDQVFAADPLLAFIKEDGTKTALISQMKHPERQLEVARAQIAAKQADFSIIKSDCIREGSGDTLFDPNHGIWFVGVGRRTAPGAGKQLQEISGRPVIEIPTLSDEFYHIDTFMSFLPKGHVVLYKDAMTPEAYKLICALYPEDKRLEINRRAAMIFAANPQIVTEYISKEERQHTIIIPRDAPSAVTSQLKRWGYHTESIDIKAARRAGGGIHCCFQRVWDLRKYPLHPLPDALSDVLAISNNVLAKNQKITTWGLASRSGGAQALAVQELIS